MTLSYGRLSMFVLGMDMKCPLCGVTVLSGERHDCFKEAPKKLAEKKRQKPAKRKAA